MARTATKALPGAQAPRVHAHDVRAREGVLPPLSPQPAVRPAQIDPADITTEDAAAAVAQAIQCLDALDAAIRELNAKKSAIYREMKGRGFNVGAMRTVLRERRIDPLVRGERRAAFQMYWDAVMDQLGEVGEQAAAAAEAA